MPGGVRTEIHLAAADTAGAFCLLVDEPPPGWSLPPHRHHNEAETIHIVEGSFEMDIDGKPARLGPGQTIHIPRGVIHSGGIVGDQAGRRILMFSPGGLEVFFLEVGAPSPGAQTDPGAALRSASRHGWEFVSGA
jgi:quercetin dioxygenase-like cupin family protein